MVGATAERQFEQVLSIEQTAGNYQLMDDFPLLALARDAERQRAHEIVESKMQLLRDGEFARVDIPVDALGTARKVIEVGKVHKEGSLEYLETREGLDLDCQRLLAEAARKTTWEYFPKVRQEYHEDDGQYYSHSMSIQALTEAGLTPIAEPEEQERRVNEHVEEVSFKLGRMALGSTVKIRTASLCPDWAITAYRHKSKGGWGGYVPEIKKIMLRDVSFEETSFDRFEEQMAVSGEIILPEDLAEAFARRGAMVEGMTKTELHGAQIVARDDLLEFQALLDQVTSERTGLNVFMGEAVDPEHVKDYAGVRAEAEARQQKLEVQSKELATFVMDLEKAGTDRWLAIGLVENKVKALLLEAAKKDHDIALAAFDAKTYHGIREVAYLQSIGQTDNARLLMARVAQEAPAPGYCGAGSCGLEIVSPNSEAAKLAKEKGLDTSGELLRSTETTCPNPKCGEKGKVIYDRKGGGVCESCKATK